MLQAWVTLRRFLRSCDDIATSVLRHLGPKMCHLGPPLRHLGPPLRHLGLPLRRLRRLRFILRCLRSHAHALPVGTLCVDKEKSHDAPKVRDRT